MAENSKISWTDATFNPWIGCTKVSAGCRSCYAENLMDTRYGKAQWGPNGTRVLTSPANWKLPLKWNREAQQEQERWACGGGINKGPRPGRRRVFCASLADVFEDWQGVIHDHNGVVVGADEGKISRAETRVHMPATMDVIRRDLFALIDATPHLDWLLLTKRPENVRGMWPKKVTERSPGSFLTEAIRSNVWLGSSIACKSDLRNIDHLYGCADLCPVRFISAEPLIEDVGRMQFAGIDWLIIGGESGPNARPCNVAWIRSLRDQARAAGVACFVKQLGCEIIDRGATAAHSFPERECWPDGTRQDGQAILLRNPKGGDPAEWPLDLRVREFPTAVSASR